MSIFDPTDFMICLKYPSYPLSPFIMFRCELQRITPRWEDGLRQLDVPKRYMRQFVAEDDASASKGVPLTADVVEHLTWIGKTVGPVVDEVRKAVHLTALTKVTPTNLV